MRWEKMSLLLAGVGFFCFCAVVWLSPSADISVTERRKLAEFPELTAASVTDGSFMQEFESYALDQFPLRDQLRSVKAWISRTVFRQKEEHGIYVSDGYAVKMEYPLNEDSLENAVGKFQGLYERYLDGQDCQIYTAVIPDKNYFLGQTGRYLTMDYDRLFSYIREGMPYAQWIGLADQLDISDYYRTDIHWRQESLVDLASFLGRTMGIVLSGEYETKTLEQEFYGVYSGQAALGLPGERLSYLTSETLEQCTVYNYETEAVTGIYDLEKAAGSDLYEIFLSGSVSVLKIENPAADTDRELVVFRDSFASSLVPLLAEGYRTITLVDIRYIQSGLLDRFVEFSGKDVLFLYSTGVLNHSETLK